MGKGGVGRTTVSAAIGAALARRGRKTLLFQSNARKQLAQILGGPPVGEAVVPMRDHLWAVRTNPNAALHEYGLMVLRYETIYRMVLENKVAKSLVRAIPGVDDYSIVGKCWWHTTEKEPDGRPRWDTVVFDGPATGHAVTMLRIPRAILSAVPEGPLTRDAVKVRELLEDPARCAVVLVTLAEEMPTNETVELAARLRELDLHPSWLVVNQLYPDRFPRGSATGRVLEAALAGGAADDPGLAPLVRPARTLAIRRALNERYLGRLRAELGLPEVDLPILFAPVIGPAEIETLSSLLEQATTGADEAHTRGAR